MSFLIRNCKALTLHPASLSKCDLRIDDGMIVDRAPHLKPRKDEDIIDLGGQIVMAGLVNAHTHLYSSLSRGMPAPKTAPKNFVEILQKIWWNLDECLDEEAVYYNALIGAIESIKFGTTSIIDHHASPNAISGSLDLIKNALMKVGLRGLLCYETTDRGGMKKRDLALQENERFVTENANSKYIRGTFGAHASFTLSTDSLKQLGDLATIYDTGVHIHVAEDLADVRDSQKKFKMGIIDRFEKAGLLRKKSIFAHGVHLTKNELKRIDAAGAWMMHQPRSNMNNNVGHSPLSWFGAHAALGTDGFPSDMFEEATIGFYRNGESEHRSASMRIPELLQNGNSVMTQFFGMPFGTLQPGSTADLIVLEYLNPTPFTNSNALGHFLFGMNSSNVRHTMVAGNWIMWNHQIISIDEDAIMAQAQKVASTLWKKMSK